MFSEKFHRYVFLFGIFSFAFGMMMGAVPTSVPQLIIAVNWILEGNFKWKWSQIKSNKLFWIISAAFFAHVIGLLYTNNLSNGWDDVRTKIPLMFLPLVFFTAKPLSLKEFYFTLYCFLLGCMINTAWCMVYSFALHQDEVVRDASRFMSHIRLGLYLNVAIATSVYLAVKTTHVLKRSGLIALAVYFIFVLYMLGLASGLANFVILFLLVLCYMIYRQKTVIKVAALIVVVGFLALVVNYVAEIKEAQLRVKPAKNNELQKFSPSGRPYLHYDEKGQKENGNYIQINIQPEEIYRRWNGEFPSDSFNYAAGHNLQRYVVLIRYLSSKGLNKDSAGFAQLSAEDKTNIQKGISNYEYPNWSHLHKRTYELINEYDEFMNDRFVNGHSLTMRLYFWKAALHQIGKHFLFGVGTGDVQEELNKSYLETNTPLDGEWHKRPHNQFLTITVALGIFGLLAFLASIIYPAATLKTQLPKLYWPFFIIAILSFFLEDTLETQAGCTFYAFFTALFVSVAWFRKSVSIY